MAVEEIVGVWVPVSSACGEYGGRQLKESDSRVQKLPIAENSELDAGDVQKTLEVLHDDMPVGDRGGG